MAKKFFYVCVAGLAVVIGSALPRDSNAQVVVAPYGSCGWRWVPLYTSVDPLVIASVGFDDSGWSAGCEPFVASWGCSPPGTVLPENANNILIRRRIYNSGPPTSAHYSVRGRYQLWAYWNGHYGDSGMFGNACPITDALTGSFPLDHGDNVVLFRGTSIVAVNPFEQFGGHFDIQITADQFTSARQGSWGELKVIYR